MEGFLHMKKLQFAIIPLFFLLLGCKYENHLILREPVPHDDYQSGKTRTLYQGTSFWEISRAVNENGPKSNSHIRKKGSISFSGSKYRQSFDFTYQYNHQNDWHIIFFKKDLRKFSLHFNKLGLTFQDVDDDVFIQSHEQIVWDKLHEHLYLHQLKAVTESLKTPNFDHTLPWIAEVDGLKYFVIARALKIDHQDLKEEIYFHKKSQSLSRRLKTTMNQGIVEDVTYASYRDVGDYYQPHSVTLQYPTQFERVDINISEMTITDDAEPQGQLKEL